MLVLISSAGVVSALDKRKKLGVSAHGAFWRFIARLDLLYYAAFAALFVLTTIGVMVQTPSGVGIALCFIAAILGMSVVSRAWRADELRTIGFEFKDEQSKFLWDSLRLADFPVLVPHRPGRQSREEKEKEIRADHQLLPPVDIVFVEIGMGDPSDFFQRLLIEVMREETGVRHPGDITACRCRTRSRRSRWRCRAVSKPPALHFGWTELDLLSASWSYLAFGEGNIPWKVRELIHRAEKEPAKRPRVIVG